MFTLEQLRQPKRMRARKYHLFSADENIVWSFRVSESKQPQRKLKPRHCSDWYIPSMEATYPIPVKLLLMYESDVFTINIVHTQRVSDSRLVVKFVCYRSDWKSWSFVQDTAWSTPCYLLLSGCQISKKKAWRNRHLHLHFVKNMVSLCAQESTARLDCARFSPDSFNVLRADFLKAAAGQPHSSRLPCCT